MRPLFKKRFAVGVYDDLLSVEKSNFIIQLGTQLFDRIKREYLPAYAKEEWQKNFVYLSTWNEYGEGTFMMPTTDEKGFGYLDVLREAYTDEPVSAAVNTRPSEQQKARINRLYPQYRRLLRRECLEAEKSADDYESFYTVDLATAKISASQIESLTQDENGLSGVSGADAAIIFNAFEQSLNLADIKAVRITAQAPKGTILSFFHITDKDSAWNEEKRRNFTSQSDDMLSLIHI